MRLFRNSVLFALLAASTFADTAETADPVLRIQTSVDKTSFAIGDELTFTVSVVFDPAVAVVKPGPGTGLGEFEIRRYDFRNPERRADGLAEDVTTYVLTAWETGELLLPALEARGRFSNRTLTVRSQPIPVRVMSLAEERGSNLNLAENREPVALSPLPPWPVTLGVFAVLLLLGAGAWFLLRPAGGPPGAAEEALAALRSLEEANLWNLERSTDHYYALSHLVRAYAERAHGGDWLNRSTRETLDALAAHGGLPDDLREFLVQFLPAADEVKYAGVAPPEEATREWHRRLRKILTDAESVRRRARENA